MFGYSLCCRHIHSGLNAYSDAGDSSATTSFPLDKALLPILQEVLQSAMACISSSSDETAAPDSLLAPASGTASGYGELLQSQTGPSMYVLESDYELQRSQSLVSSLRA